MKVRHNLEVKGSSKKSIRGLSRTIHHDFTVMAASNADANETEPLLLRGHGQYPTAADMPEVEGGVQPPGDVKLFYSLLVDSIPGLSCSPWR
jgi:hypothetical protein